MLIEAVPVGVESCQLSPIIVFDIRAPIHGRVLLVTENNAITGLALSCAFTALTADGLVFVAFELSLAASKTVTGEINRIPWGSVPAFGKLTILYETSLPRYHLLGYRPCTISRS